MKSELDLPIKHKITRWIQTCIGLPIKWLSVLADKRRGSPSFLKKLIGYIVVPLVTLFLSNLGLSKTATPDWYSSLPFSSLITYQVAFGFLVSIVAAFAIFVLLEAVLPMLFYAPSSFSMRTMGLLYTDVSQDAVQKVLRIELQSHDQKTAVRVICISGNTLLVDSRTKGVEAPLQDFAKRGLVEILMPTTDEKNPTIDARYKEYDDHFREKRYPSIQTLLEEVKHTKDILRKNATNKVIEHNVLCMWRVILLSHRCIAQNYFPNHTGADSDDSPVFVFERPSDSSKFSYYYTFDQMFSLLTKLPPICQKPQKIGP